MRTSDALLTFLVSLSDLDDEKVDAHRPVYQMIDDTPLVVEQGNAV